MKLIDMLGVNWMVHVIGVCVMFSYVNLAIIWLFFACFGFKTAQI